MGAAAFFAKFIRGVVSALAIVTLAGHDVSIAYGNSCRYVLAPETAFSSKPSAAKKKAVQQKHLSPSPLFSKESVLKGTRLWSALKKLNGGEFPAIVDLKGTADEAAAQFAEKINAIPARSLVCLSLEISDREKDRVEPGLLRNVTRHIMVVDTPSSLKAAFKKHILPGDLALHEFHFVLSFGQYDDERTIHWGRISLGRPAGVVVNGERRGLLDMIGKGLMRRPLGNIVKLIKREFPGYALTANAVNAPFVEHVFKTRGFNYVRAADLGMSGVIRQVKGIEGYTVDGANVIFARVPESDRPPEPVQRTLDMIVPGDESAGIPSRAEEIAGRSGIIQDLDGSTVGGVALSEWLREHDLTLSYPRIVDVYGEYDAKEYIRELYKLPVRDIKGELAAFSNEAGVYDETMRRMASRYSREELYPLILWMADLKHMTQKQQDREGKLFGSIDVSGKKLRDLPIWPVGENGEIREDLIEWMRIPGRAPPPEYYLSPKMSYDELAALPPKDRPARQLAFDFGQDAAPQPSGKKTAVGADYLRVKAPYYSERTIRDGKPLVFNSPADAATFGERLVNERKAYRYGDIVAGGTVCDVVIENGIGMTGETAATLFNDAVQAMKDAGLDVTRMPQTLVIGFVDQSRTLFEDHIRNGFIGVNCALNKIKDEKVRSFILQVGVFHEFCHEATGGSGAAFETAQLVRDAEFGAAEAVRGGIAPGMIYDLLLPILTPEFAVLTGRIAVLAEPIPRVLQPLSLPELITKSGLSEAQISRLRERSAGVMTLYEFLKDKKDKVRNGFALGLTSFVSYRDFYDAVAGACGLMTWDAAHVMFYGDRGRVRTNLFLHRITAVENKPVVFFIPNDVFVYPESATTHEVAWCLDERNAANLKNAYFVFGLYDAVNDRDYNRYFSRDAITIEERVRLIQGVYDRFQDHLTAGVASAERPAAAPEGPERFGELKSEIAALAERQPGAMFKGSMDDLMSGLRRGYQPQEVSAAVTALMREDEIAAGVGRDRLLRIKRPAGKARLAIDPQAKRLYYQDVFGSGGDVVTPYVARQLFLRLEAARFLMDAYNNRSMGFEELAPEGSDSQKAIAGALERPIAIAKDLLAKRGPLAGRMKDVATSAGELVALSGTYPEDLISELSLDSLEKMAALALLNDEVDRYFAAVSDALGAMHRAISAAQAGAAQPGGVPVDEEIVQIAAGMHRLLEESYAKWSDKSPEQIEEMLLMWRVLPYQPDHVTRSMFDARMRELEFDMQAGRELIDQSS